MLLPTWQLWQQVTHHTSTARLDDSHLIPQISPEVRGVAHAQAFELQLWHRLAAVAEDAVEQHHIAYCARHHPCSAYDIPWPREHSISVRASAKSCTCNMQLSSDHAPPQVHRQTKNAMAITEPEAWISAPGASFTPCSALC